MKKSMVLAASLVATAMMGVGPSTGMEFKFLKADPPLDVGVNCSADFEAKNIGMVQNTIKAFENDASATVHDAFLDFGEVLGLSNTGEFLKFVNATQCRIN